MACFLPLFLVITLTIALAYHVIHDVYGLSESEDLRSNQTKMWLPILHQINPDFKLDAYKSLGGSCNISLRCKSLPDIYAYVDYSDRQKLMIHVHEQKHSFHYKNRDQLYLGMLNILKNSPQIINSELEREPAYFLDDMGYVYKNTPSILKRHNLIGRPNRFIQPRMMRNVTPPKPQIALDIDESLQKY